MGIRKSIVACLFGVAGALALAGCGNHANTPAASGAASAASSAPLASLSIASWGPQETKAGEVFNKQPNGSAALWLRMNQSLDGDTAAVAFNGTLLPTVISGNLVTLAIPAPLYAAAGSVKLHVVAHRGEQSAQSNDVTFTIK